MSLELPYIDGDKESILQDAIVSCDELKLNFETIFANTNTSYDPDEAGRSSGKTGSDIERILAFHAIGREDPVEYQDDWSEVLSHALSIESQYMDKVYREKLTEIQYQVTRNSATERALLEYMTNISNRELSLRLLRKTRSVRLENIIQVVVGLLSTQKMVTPILAESMITVMVWSVLK